MIIDLNTLPKFHYTQKNLVNFTSKVEFEYLPNGEINYDSHMLFVNNIDKDGYGRFWFKTRSLPAHRFSFMVEYGQLPYYIVVRHKNFCNIRNCVNPSHLECGTQADNVQDMINLGTLITGQDSNFSSHENTQIQNLILDIYNGELKSYKECYVKYNMTQENLSLIMRGQIWKKVVQPLLEQLNTTIDELRKKILVGVPKGENHLKAKLNWDIVDIIREECKDQKNRSDKYYTMLANKYNVSLSSIKCVVYNRSWIK